MECFYENYTTLSLTDKKQCFKHCDCAKYATDCMFQNANCPSGLDFTEAKEYLSEKHKEHGFEIEISVLPVRLCIYSSRNKPADAADMTMFRDNLEWY